MLWVGRCVCGYSLSMSADSSRDLTEPVEEEEECVRLVGYPIGKSAVCVALRVYSEQW